MNQKNQTPIDPNPQTNPSGRPPLSEKDFIRNGWTFGSFPFWLWAALAALALLFIWGSTDRIQSFIQNEKRQDPFLEVTNREFSLFLWQFPSYMRVHASSQSKSGYLPGFLTDSANFSPATAEEFVSAPPDLIFLYHTWHRLLSNDLIARPIGGGEFEQFLLQLPEWSPSNWVMAPEGYARLIASNQFISMSNLQALPEDVLPHTVRQAFLGWKNYFKEGEQINSLQPTFGQVKEFLDKHPHYARNYWRNISEVYGQPVGGMNYLAGFIEGTFKSEEFVPMEQVPPFLKAALYNAKQLSQDK